MASDQKMPAGRAALPRRPNVPAFARFRTDGEEGPIRPGQRDMKNGRSSSSALPCPIFIVCGAARSGLRSGLN
jgi:hypothetical protein